MSRKTSAEQPRRLKVTLACIICRKKKVKCDGVQPTCSRCNSMGIQCQYSDPPKKRGPPKGYVEVINNRAHRIESLLGKQKTSSPTSTSTTNTNNNNATTTTTTSTRPFSSSSYSSSLSSTTSSAWSPSITTNNGNGGAETLVHPPATLLPQQQNDVLKLITDAASAVQAKWTNNPGSHNSMYASTPANNNSNDKDDNSVSSGLALLWANNVFQHFNIFFPMLSRQHFLYQLVHRKHTMNPLLRYAVYALGCRYINPEDRTARLWFDKAQVLADHEIHASLSTVQALAIMCWYTYLAGDLQQCSRLRRQLYRAVYDCNLGQEATNCSVVEQEMRRRGLWASYVIDQWLAVCTGERIQPVTSWDVKLPKLEDNQLYAIDCRNLQPPVDLHELSVESALQVAVFAEMVKLVNVVCGNDDANIKTALTEWLLSLPPYLEFGKATDDTPPSPIARIFHMLYYTVQVMINRPIYHHHYQQQQQQQIVDHDGTTAANTIIYIAEQMVRNHEVKYLYNVFGLSLTLATTIHLENARLSDSASANNNLTRSLSVVKQSNCTVVPRVDLDRVLHRFVVNRCGVVLDHYYHHHHHQQQQQQQPRASLHQQYPYGEVRPTNLKRPCLGDDLERTVKRPSFDFSRWLPPEQQQYTIPSSSFSTTTTGDYSNLVDFFTTAASTTNNTTTATTPVDDGIVTATADIAAVAAAAAAGLRIDCWNNNNNEQQHNLFASDATSAPTTHFYQHSPSSSSSSPMVTPKPANPSPALTMATTPIESSPTSYFSPHVNSTSSPSLLSTNGFDLSKEDDIRELVSDNFYSTIDFQNTII